MSDEGPLGPPTDGLPEPEPDSTAKPEGLWPRYRSLPLWLQIVAPLVLIGLIVGGVVWATGASDNDEASPDTTTASGGRLELIVTGLIVAGALDESSVPSSTTPGSTTPSSTATATSTETTAAPTTSTEPATTASAAPVTSPPATTAAPVPTTERPTTAAPTTTESAATTEPPDTTEAPSTTVEPSTSLPTVAAFFDQWNAATAGTDVPRISGTQLTELTGPYAGYYLVPLTPTHDVSFPPQVGLVGRATSPGSGQLEELLLVWIPGPDESSTAFYWEAFGVLVQAVSPGTSAAESDALATSLGEAPGTPPLTASDTASLGGLGFRASSIAYDGEAGELDVSAIEIRDL